jgi:hypothetical protein
MDNPSWWPVARGVPLFRPMERGIDFAERPLGQNTGEFVFLLFMLSGVQLVGVRLAVTRWLIHRSLIELCSWEMDSGARLLEQSTARSSSTR